MRVAEHVTFFSDIARVLGGKGQLRLILQPVLAIILGIRLGLADAHSHSEPFVIRLFRSHEKLVRRALSDVVIPFAVAVVIDMILQYYTLGRIRPGASLLVATTLVWIPFSAARGITNRIARSHSPAVSTR
jgi:hypothetical protein